MRGLKNLQSILATKGNLTNLKSMLKIPILEPESILNNLLTLAAINVYTDCMHFETKKVNYGNKEVHFLFLRLSIDNVSL